MGTQLLKIKPHILKRDSDLDFVLASEAIGVNVKVVYKTELTVRGEVEWEECSHSIRFCAQGIDACSAVDACTLENFSHLYAVVSF